ncbi:MAG: hypothetical protein H6669_14865 [Ardenticatenaceae bacterium]|nr:hypothetical protein [Ardenticatenaceae bacterium]
MMLPLIFRAFWITSMANRWPLTGAASAVFTRRPTSRRHAALTMDSSVCVRLMSGTEITDEHA